MSPFFYSVYEASSGWDSGSFIALLEIQVSKAGPPKRYGLVQMLKSQIINLWRVIRCSCSWHPADWVPQSAAVHALSCGQIKTWLTKDLQLNKPSHIASCIPFPMCDHFAREQREHDSSKYVSFFAWHYLCMMCVKWDLAWNRVSLDPLVLLVHQAALEIPVRGWV